MIEKFQIYINLLKNSELKINLSISSSELDINSEKDIIFIDPIKIDGKAYLAENELIINLNMNFTISKACKICNDFTKKDIVIKNFYIIKNLNEIKGIFDFGKEIRNACLLEIPSFVECNDNCLERKNLKKYLHREKGNFPFSNL